MAPPLNPKIYHILHVDRLRSVIGSGALFSDTQLNARTDLGTMIGMGNLKADRLVKPVDCHAGLTVGGCVPFYLCSRSLMLYVIWKANHPNLSYRGGQRPIIHLEADMRRVAAWADQAGLRWAFTLGNATARYAEFRSDMDQLSDIKWTAVRGTDFSSPDTKDAKQAEFLVESRLPWSLVERVGVMDNSTATAVGDILNQFDLPRPRVEIQRGWYYG